MSLSYQNFSALDDVQFVNGNQLGTRVLLQVRAGKGDAGPGRSKRFGVAAAGGRAGASGSAQSVTCWLPCCCVVCVPQVDQGLNFKVPLPGGKSVGLSGGLFNRCQATFTK